MATDGTVSSEDPPAEVSPADPAAMDWQLSQWIEADRPVDLVPGATISMQLDAGQISGSGGCNRFGGDYQLQGDRLTVENLRSTGRACDGPITAQEERFFSALQSAVRLVREGDTTLTVVYGAEPSAGQLVFTR